jgi:hypothetical protein
MSAGDCMRGFAQRATVDVALAGGETQTAALPAGTVNLTDTRAPSPGTALDVYDCDPTV